MPNQFFEQPILNAPYAYPGRHWELDVDGQAEFCRVAEAHPSVLAYVKNQGLGLEVPYLLAGTPRKYLPDFIVQLDDTPSVTNPSIQQSNNPLNLIVEIKGFRGEDAKEKANTMRSYWVPGVNNLGKFGRWAFAEFTSVFEIDADFAKLIKSVTANERK
jgi:type III restriction enzyme